MNGPSQQLPYAGGGGRSASTGGAASQQQLDKQQAQTDEETFGAHATGAVAGGGAVTGAAPTPAANEAATSGGGKKQFSPQVEAAANSYFQNVYSQSVTIPGLVQQMQLFKASELPQEQMIYQCMVHNLFDEYRFFPNYPEKELRITGILFGTLIQHQLVSSITLGIALRYVLEALRKPPGPGANGKIFRFGMFALEQFKDRLYEWPQYCSHIVQIDHLCQQHPSLVEDIQRAMKSAKGESEDHSAAKTKRVFDDGGLGDVASEALPQVADGDEEMRDTGQESKFSGPTGIGPGRRIAGGIQANLNSEATFPSNEPPPPAGDQATGTLDLAGRLRATHSQMLPQLNSKIFETS